jgi:peptidoglycan/LPS O-acetylase OafA/YrhL
MLEIVFVVLMIFWFLCGGACAYYPPDQRGPWVWGNTLIPWACVAILGYCFFSGYAVHIPQR